MKNLIVLFALMLFSVMAQSQTVTEKEITGTWQVTNIVDAGAQPKQAEEMMDAYIDIYPDYNFQLRMKTSKGYQDTFKNYKWSFNEDTQTIEVDNGNMSIKTSISDDKMIFELRGTGIKLEVVKPI